MSAETQAFITPTVLRWARERARASRDRLAKRLNTNADKVASWEAGHKHPSFKQAEKIADVLSIPFGYLFLPGPPKEELPLPDFRRVADAPAEPPSVDAIAVLNDVLFKQQRYREMLVEQGRSALGFVKSFPIGAPPRIVAADIREKLAIGMVRENCSNAEGFLRGLIERAELLGILVMRSGIAVGNTRRPLSVEEFRGFAVCDPYAPVIFLNSRDSTAAQVFTFAHEVAHIWIGESGISNPSLANTELSQLPHVERVCNAIAAEVLIPADDFSATWNDNVDASQNTTDVAKKFRVSRAVALRRAYDLGRVPRDKYLSLYKMLSSAAIVDKTKKKSGGDFYNNLIASNSQPLTEAVVFGAMEGRVLFRDAAYMLNINPTLIPKIAARLWCSACHTATKLP